MIDFVQFPLWKQLLSLRVEEVLQSVALAVPKSSGPTAQSP